MLLMFPFIYPIISKCLILIGIFDDISQIEIYVKMFKWFNVFFVSIGVILILYESNINVSEIIMNFFTNHDFKIKKGENEVEFTHFEANKYKNEIYNIVEETKEEAKEQLLNNNINKEYKENINEIENERESLRYFSAYQVTNKYSRELLREIKNSEKMQIEIFKINMQKYYQYTIRNMGKKKKQEFILKKIEELLYNLRYLNIIEYTEEGTFIILTENGKEFVRGYEEVG